MSFSPYTLIAAAVALFVAFGSGFGLEWHLRNGEEAQAALKVQIAVTKQIKHEAAVAQQAGAAGQALADNAAGAFAQVQPQIRTVTRTLTQKIPVYIPTAPQEPPDAKGPVIVYGVPCGFVRFHDALATDNPNPADVPGCSGKPDNAASDVDLPAFAAVLAENYGAFENNREQLIGLQTWARQVALWYADLVKQLQGGKPVLRSSEGAK